MDPNQAYPEVCESLTPELRSTAVEQTKQLILKIVRTNLNTQYASRAPSLAEFRDAISAHGSSSDTILVEDFWRSVPLSEYDSYKPFMAAFDKESCKEAEIEDLFAPGLPLFLAISSATSGKSPKLFPIYQRPVRRRVLNSQGPTAAVSFYGYKELKQVEREPGHVVKKIPVCIASGGLARAALGWSDVDEDDGRMPLIMPGLAAPWAASMIKHHSSFLMMHALFALSCRDLERIYTPFSTLFYDMMRLVDEEWDMYLSSIMTGVVPDLPGVDEVRPYLQAHLHPNPGRAEELREIGRPLSCEGWAARAWPKMRMAMFICSGPFATVLPKLKSIIGPTVAIRTFGYGSSECLIATPHRPDDLHIFVLRDYDLVEFLDIAAEEASENLHQPWELEVAKLYEIVLTTNDGLWRYRLGDVVEIVGFDTKSGSPVFKYYGRRSLSLRFPGISMSDTHLISAIQTVNPDVMHVSEFTTVPDDRQSTRTVGYLVELVGAPGPYAHFASSKLAEGLSAAHTEFQRQLERVIIRPPTVRVVKPGTFTEYRQWRAEIMGVGPGQVKVPVVLLDVASVDWVLERVVGEL